MKIPENEIQQAIELFNNGISITKIAKLLGRDRGSLSNRMKKAGANIVQHCNRKSVNNKFFNEWNEKSAYWLGFIFADGHLSENGSLEICIKDKEHIEKFKADIKSEHKISERIINGSSYYRITIQDKDIAKKLKELGVSHNKTYGWKVPDIPNEYMMHFIRGLFDGDGNLNVRGSSSAFRIICYDRTVLETLMNHILENVKEVNKHIRIYDYSYKIPELNISSKKALQSFLNWLYKDATVFLNRKYEKYLSLCRLWSSDDEDHR